MPCLFLLGSIEKQPFASKKPASHSVFLFTNKVASLISSGLMYDGHVFNCLTLSLPTNWPFIKRIRSRKPLPEMFNSHLVDRSSVRS